MENKLVLNQEKWPWPLTLVFQSDKNSWVAFNCLPAQIDNTSMMGYGKTIPQAVNSLLRELQIPEVKQIISSETHEAQI